MVLDALIANKDRHEQNWAVLRPRLTGPVERLAPSFDHGGALGYNLTDDKRLRMLTDHVALEAWAERGTAHRFEHLPPAKTLVWHAADAVSLCSAAAVSWWQSQLAALELKPVFEELLGLQVSGMSEAAAKFACRLLEHNLRRLRDAICSSS